jgi:pyridoxamine 5'-phosphate oxidase
MHRQVIIEGTVSALSEQDSEPYFRSRARGSQLAAWASEQSAVIASRATLEERYARLEQRWPEGTPVAMPDFWGGYRVRPLAVEFWHGRVNRMHDRFRYRRDHGGWAIERLAP